MFFLVLISLELADPTLIIDPITEERASRTLYRIELLRRIREQVLPNPLLSERLKLCQPSSDLPEWWECGRHDHDLLLGASKHGVSRTDYHILNDPTLSFLEAHQRFTSQRGSSIYMGGQSETLRAGLGVAGGAGTPLLTPAELASAAAAAKMAVGAAKDEEGLKEEVKTEEEKSQIEIKMETEDIPHMKTETPEDEKENQEEAGEGNKETTPSSKLLKAEESHTEVELQEQKPEPDEETVKAPDDGDVAVEMETATAETSGEQEVVTSKVPEISSPKEQSNSEERDDVDASKSPKSADTIKPPEEEDEERIDEDDKSEKSSQAESKEHIKG